MVGKAPDRVYGAERIWEYGKDLFCFSPKNGVFVSENGRNRAVYGVLLLVFVFFIILVLFAAYTVKAFQQEGAEFQDSGKKTSIAVVEVEGVIMSPFKTIELLQLAEKDKNTKAIILRVDSPGGAVGPTQEIYEEVRRIDEEYTTSEGKKGKPIYASFGSIAASGGYYIGAATRRIYATPGGLTGSIGVIMQFIDASKLFELARVNQINIKAGRYKDMGQPNRSMTEEEKALLEGTIKDVHKQFIDDILRTRKDKIKGDINEFSQGQIFSGREAMERGLVDELAGLWVAGRRIHEELKIEGEFGLKFIRKKKRTNVWDLVDSVDSAITSFDIRTLTQETPLLMYKF
jgi:protease-4